MAKTSLKNALCICTKDKIGRKNPSCSSPKGKISRIYENLNTDFGKTGSECQNRTVCLKGFLYNRIAILFFTHYLTIKIRCGCPGKKNRFFIGMLFFCRKVHARRDTFGMDMWVVCIV
jgi:hypothetical protein